MNLDDTVDLDYAMKQLLAIRTNELHANGFTKTADRIDRALDALERIVNREIDEALALELPPVE